MSNETAEPTNPHHDESRFSTFTEDAERVFDVQKAKFEYAKDKVQMQLDNERWKNRRRMAWISLWAAIAVPAAMFTVVPESKIEALDEVVAWFMMGCFSIIGTYIGTATWAQVSQARSASNSSSPMGNNPWDNYGGGRLDNPAEQKDNYYSEQ